MRGKSGDSKSSPLREVAYGIRFKGKRIGLSEVREGGGFKISNRRKRERPVFGGKKRQNGNDSSYHG